MTATTYHCEECRMFYMWHVTQVSQHWSEVIRQADRPAFCPCCGSFNAVKPLNEVPHNETFCPMPAKPTGVFYDQ